ncbi:general substrate transporter [Roridomyces roridus]|uniref:General substrate transporter n=1 Tax=Roridomyces roridus TaxID=1738132 RepID=A0AAD7FSP5_9AGAR|nr:general substrate transporter [Roridomyces roridus]
MVNGLQSLTQWESYFNNPTKGRLGLLNAIQHIGALAGYPFAPYLSDGIGRKPTVFLGALIIVIATVVQTTSQSVGMFIGARFLIGFGLSWAANAGPVLVAELSYPKYRASLTSAYNSLWYSGAIVAAWTTFGSFKIAGTWSWFIPSALQALPSFLQVLLIWFVPESPRFLMSKGKEKEAVKVLVYYHADGDELDYEFQEIKSVIEFDCTANVGWGSFFASPGNRERWSGNGLVSYYLNKVLSQMGITDPTDQLLINGILNIWNLAWALIASTMVERFGRRLLFLTSTGLMALFLTLQTACFARFRILGDYPAAHAALTFISLFYAAYHIGFSPLIVTYTLEILPYNIRAKGYNIFNFTVSVALMFNQYVNPIALDVLSWKYYIVYCVWISCECVIFSSSKPKTAPSKRQRRYSTVVDAATAQAGVAQDLGHREEK